MAIKNIYKKTYNTENDIKNEIQIDTIMKNKKSDNYKLIDKQVSRQISKDECRILNFLKRKEQTESKKYLKIYNESN